MVPRKNSDPPKKNKTLVVLMVQPPLDKHPRPRGHSVRYSTGVRVRLYDREKRVEKGGEETKSGRAF